MNRTMSVLALAGASLVFAAPASTHMSGPVVIIRHQTRGCHVWSVDNGAYKATLEKWGLGSGVIPTSELLK